MQKKLFHFSFLTLAATLFLANCARGPIRSSDEAMRPKGVSGELEDDLHFKDFAAAISADIARLKSYNAPLEIMKFGPRRVTREQYINALQTLVTALQEDPSGNDYLKVLQQNFDFYQVYGEKKWGDALVTGYYEPIIKGALKKTKIFTEPLYGVPKDLVVINSGEFNKVLNENKPADQQQPDKLADVNLRGRLVPAANGRIAAIVPYYSRADINSAALAKSSVPILAWVDPVDAFFLQIQGSGQIELLGHKTLRVGYAEQNGRPYIPIGRSLFDKIPREKMTRQKLVDYLRSISNTDAMAVMNINPSFVFFQKLAGKPITTFGAEVVPGRTIATDPKYFSKGALAYLEFQKPVLKGGPGAEDSATFQTVHRFVLDQDTGGAIKGPGRVDLFVGTGPDAENESGVMRHRGKLYYVVPK